MRIFGHPLHIILIHFPSALFPLDLLIALIAKWFNLPQLNIVSACMVIGGVMIGWLAFITGLFDVGRIAQRSPGSLNKALLHGAINTTVLTFYTVLAFSIYKKLPTFSIDSTIVLIIKFVAVSILIVGNFFGAELILKDKVLEK